MGFRCDSTVKRDRVLSEYSIIFAGKLPFRYPCTSIKFDTICVDKNSR